MARDESNARAKAILLSSPDPVTTDHVLLDPW
jgi:hypothetical protein